MRRNLRITVIGAVFAALATKRGPASEKEVIVNGRDEYPMPKLAPKVRDYKSSERPFRGTLPRNKYALPRVLRSKNRGRD
jgi:hypothetical protein